jgi:hypothetical protein
VDHSELTSRELRAKADRVEALELMEERHVEAMRPWYEKWGPKPVTVNVTVGGTLGNSFVAASDYAEKMMELVRHEMNLPQEARDERDAIHAKFPSRYGR